MNQFSQAPQNVASDRGLTKFLSKVFGWMFLGLLATALVAAGVWISLIYNEGFRQFVSQYYSGVFIIAIAEVLLVMYLSRRAMSLSAGAARMLFLLYAAINGITIGLIALAYSDVVAQAFLTTAITFGVMCTYGLITKNDLTRIGSLLIMGLFGLIIVSVVNIFMQSPMIYWLISIAGIAIFLALTAYDTQKLKNIYYATGGDGSPATANIPIIGALQLYLDFVNLFLYFMRLFGRRN